MKNLVVLLSLCLSFCLSSPLKAQQDQAVQTLEELNQRYANLSRFYTEMDIRVFAGEGQQAVVEKRAVIYKKGDQYRYEVDDNTMIYNHQCVVLIDPHTRTILYSEEQRDELAKKMKTTEMPDIQAWLKGCDSISLKQDAAGREYYLIHQSGQLIRSMHLYLDPVTGLMEELWYFYDPGQVEQNNRVCIRYSGMTTNPRFNAATFSASAVVKKEKNRLVPREAYRDYQLIDDNDLQ